MWSVFKALLAHGHAGSHDMQNSVEKDCALVDETRLFGGASVFIPLLHKIRATRHHVDSVWEGEIVPIPSHVFHKLARAFGANWLTPTPSVFQAPSHQMLGLCTPARESCGDTGCTLAKPGDPLNPQTKFNNNQKDSCFDIGRIQRILPTEPDF